MKALITTSKSICVFDTNGDWQSIHKEGGLYYGMTRFQSKIAVASRRRIVETAASMGPAEDSGCLVILDPVTGESSVLEPNINLRDLHGIAAVGKTIWCSCSYDNAIAIMQNDHFSLWHPLGKPSAEPLDKNHINTIVEHRDGVYILAHNWGESEAYLINPDSLEIIWRKPLGKGAHNIWFDDDNMRVCSSLDHSLVGLDGLNIYLGGHPRGYCSNGKVRLVGITEFGTREERLRRTGEIFILDMDYKKIASVPLTGEGQILDIMEISDAEFETFKLNGRQLGGSSERLMQCN